MKKQENIEKIGYYKYAASYLMFNDICIREYPITEEIISYLKKLGNIKYEFEGNKPKLINGKLVVFV